MKKPHLDYASKLLMKKAYIYTSNFENYINNFENIMIPKLMNVPLLPRFQYFYKTDTSVDNKPIYAIFESDPSAIPIDFSNNLWKWKVRLVTIISESDLPTTVLKENSHIYELRPRFFYVPPHLEEIKALKEMVMKTKKDKGTQTIQKSKAYSGINPKCKEVIQAHSSVAPLDHLVFHHICSYLTTAPTNKQI